MKPLRPISGLRAIVIASLLLVATACTTLEHSAAVALDRQASWVILPVANQSDTPQAGLRMESLLESQLRNTGVQSLRSYPSDTSNDLLLDPRERQLQDRALLWARDQGARYAVTGAVTEWRYKTGVDGEPAVGMTLQIIDAQTGKVLYSASGARTGWSREALSAVAQKLTREMLDKAGL